MHGYGLFHSAGLIRPIIRSNNDVTNSAPSKQSHTAPDNGDRNENKLGAAVPGFLYKILIPKVYRFLF